MKIRKNNRSYTFHFLREDALRGTPTSYTGTPTGFFKYSEYDDRTKWVLSEDGDCYEMTPEYKTTVIESGDKQLLLWLDDILWHNDVINECLPDFSCCGGKVWDKELKLIFINGSSDVRDKMCMMSLGQLIDDLGLTDEVYIAGDTQEVIH